MWVVARPCARRLARAALYKSERGGRRKRPRVRTRKLVEENGAESSFDERGVAGVVVGAIGLGWGKGCSEHAFANVADLGVGGGVGIVGLGCTNRKNTQF